MKGLYSFLRRRVVNSDDLPTHWEERHLFNGPNITKNYEVMKKERAEEEWTIIVTFVEIFFPTRTFLIK